jgi:hypothetical protein
MISFASLFVGLVFGLVNVQLVAARGVDRVDLLLDGRSVAEVREPWRAPLDLGCEPAPHELVAVAYDAKGKEVGRVRQWVNRPRAVAEASLVLEPAAAGGKRVARLSWRSLVAETPTSILVSFDGRPVPAPDPSRIEIPPHDARQVHFLRAVLDFGRGVTATAEAIFGGPRSAESFSEMTAVPVVLDEGATLPPPEELAGWFEKDGVPLEVTAVEEGPGEAVFVCEGSSREAFGPVTGGKKDSLPPELAEEFGFRFLWPVPTMTPQTTMVTNLYPASLRFAPADGSVRFIAGRRVEWPPYDARAPRVADAVAVAGLTAADRERRRAVVLVLGGSAASDASFLSARETAGFLSKLGVPLSVWSTSKKPAPLAAQWPGVTTVQTGRQFDAALATLFKSLARQRIVWVAGTHLPHTVELGPLARGVRLAR